MPAPLENRDSDAPKHEIPFSFFAVSLRFRHMDEPERCEVHRSFEKPAPVAVGRVLGICLHLRRSLDGFFCLLLCLILILLQIGDNLVFLQILPDNGMEFRPVSRRLVAVHLGVQMLDVGHGAESHSEAGRCDGNHRYEFHRNHPRLFFIVPKKPRALEQTRGSCISRNRQRRRTGRAS